MVHATLAEPVITMGWGDVAIVKEEKLVCSPPDNDTPPAIVPTSDDSCGESDDSENEDSSLSDDVQCDLKLNMEENRHTRVRFSIVQTRQHALTIGDHPLTGALPISLDWPSYNLQDVSVDNFEEKRKPRVHASGNAINARRLLLSQRLVRLMNITGASAKEIEAIERRRQKLSLEEKHRAAIGLPPLM